MGQAHPRRHLQALRLQANVLVIKRKISSKGISLTLEFTANEMTVELCLRNKKLQFTCLSCRLSLLLLYLEAVHRLLLLALAQIPFFFFVLLPEHLHLAHETFGPGLDIF